MSEMPGIGACSEISRAFRCARIFTHFTPNFVDSCRISVKSPNLPCPSPRASPKLCAVLREGCPPSVCSMRRGCVESNKIIRAKIKYELSKQLEQVKYAADGDDFHAVGIGLELIQRSVRNGDPFEAEASALMDSDVNAGDGPAFAGKTDFAERDQILAHGQIAQRGDQRERRGHIGGRLVQPQGRLRR